MSVQDKIAAFSEHLQQRGLLRTRCVSDPSDTRFIYFDSNDYLSLTEDPRIAEAYQEGYKHYPCGSGASMLLSGYHANHRALESAFASLLAVDECLLFSSGYAANLAVTALLSSIQVHCAIDKEIHASVYDGLKHATGRFSRFIHNDMRDLARILEKAPSESVVMTEGVFSMSGQKAPLAQIADICKDYSFPMIVDEAHAFGIIGDKGQGSVALHGLTQLEVPLRVIPLGKACAAQGAIVAGKKEWIDALMQAGRSLVYSTSVSPALSYGLLNTLDIVVAADVRRKKLSDLIVLFKKHIEQSPLAWTDSDTPIQHVVLGCPFLAVQYAQHMKEFGICCSAVRAPTVRPKATGLRFIINYHHTEEQIKRLFDALHHIHERTPHTIRQG